MDFLSGNGNYGHISTVLFSNVYEIMFIKHTIILFLGCNCPFIVV